MTERSWGAKILEARRERPHFQQIPVEWYWEDLAAIDARALWEAGLCSQQQQLLLLYQ